MTATQAIQSEIKRIDKVIKSLKKTKEMSSCKFTKELLGMEISELLFARNNLTEVIN
jgi:hypothetical protein